MKHIFILIPEGDASLSSIEASYKMFTKTNEALERARNSPVFKVEMVGLRKEATLSNGFITIHPERTIEETGVCDLVIIPAVHGDMKQVIAANRAALPWLVRQREGGAEIASLCIGAFILASTGLLDGRTCTTHWLMADEFRSMFPKVHLAPSKVLTDEGGIYTSGGAYTSLNLILYLVEKFAGRQLAVLSSKIFEIEIDRDSQSPFIMFRGQKEHDDDCVRKAQEFIENHFREKINVTRLADMLALSRRSLERRFKKATSNTIVEYIQRVKMEAAKKSFETSRKNINEIMYEIGYSDSKAFRGVFKRLTGLSPIEYKNKYAPPIAAGA